MDDLAFSQGIQVSEELIEHVLKKIQTLDPAGIGARDLKECLLLQINRNIDGNISKYTAKNIRKSF